MGLISWEPRHGKFTGRYPWALYGDITDNLRYTVYTIIALDSCLRAEIQAPRVLRDIFAQEMGSVGKEVRLSNAHSFARCLVRAGRVSLIQLSTTVQVDHRIFEKLKRSFDELRVPLSSRRLSPPSNFHC
jgi:hypothetical protein